MPGLSNQISNATYTQTDLVKIADKINGEKAKTGKSGLRFFAGVCFDASTFNYTGASPFPVNPVYTQSFSPAISLGIDGFNNRDIKKPILRFELLLAENSYSISGNSTNFAAASISTQRIKQLNVMLIPQLIYNIYNTKPFKFYLDAGIGLNFSTYPTNTYTTDYNGVFPTAVRSDYPDLSKFWVSAPLKAGIEVNEKIGIYAGFSPSVSIAGDSAFSGNVTHYAGGINYLFGPK